MSKPRSKPFQSQLIPVFNEIRSLRRRRKTWREIAELLKPLGIETSGSAIFQFYKRHVKRPVPLGMIEVADSDRRLTSDSGTNNAWASKALAVEDLDLSFSDPLDEFVKPQHKK